MRSSSSEEKSQFFVFLYRFYDTNIHTPHIHTPMPCITFLILNKRRRKQNSRRRLEQQQQKKNKLYNCGADHQNCAFSIADKEVQYSLSICATQTRLATELMESMNKKRRRKN